MPEMRTYVTEFADALGELNGTLTVLVAETASGKSLGLVYIAAKMATEGNPVYFVESPLARGEAGIYAEAILLSMADPRDDGSRFAAAMNNFSIHRPDSWSPTPDLLESLLVGTVSPGVKAIMVDDGDTYALPAVGTVDRQRSMAATLTVLRRMAVSRDCPVFISMGVRNAQAALPDLQSGSVARARMRTTIDQAMFAADNVVSLRSSMTGNRLAMSFTPIKSRRGNVGAGGTHLVANIQLSVDATYAARMDIAAAEPEVAEPEAESLETMLTRIISDMSADIDIEGMLPQDQEPMA